MKQQKAQLRLSFNDDELRHIRVTPCLGCAGQLKRMGLSVIVRNNFHKRNGKDEHERFCHPNCVEQAAELCGLVAAVSRMIFKKGVKTYVMKIRRPETEYHQESRE